MRERARRNRGYFFNGIQWKRSWIEEVVRLSIRLVPEKGSCPSALKFWRHKPLQINWIVRMVKCLMIPA